MSDINLRGSREGNWTVRELEHLLRVGRVRLDVDELLKERNRAVLSSPGGVGSVSLAWVVPRVKIGRSR